jgi:hypothetical protein
MRGFGKQLVAGLIVAIFIATATYLVIYTAGFAFEDQMAVAEANTNRVNGPQANTTFIPTPPITPTPTPTPPPPVRVGANLYWDLQTAYDSYNDPTETTVIEMLEGNLPGSLDAWRPINITIKGGFDTTYNPPNSGITIMQGEITLSSGSLTVEQVGIGSLP